MEQLKRILKAENATFSANVAVVDLPQGKLTIEVLEHSYSFEHKNTHLQWAVFKSDFNAREWFDDKKRIEQGEKELTRLFSASLSR